MMEKLSALQLSADIKAGKKSVIDSVMHSIEAIRTKDKYNAFLTVCDDYAISQAKKLQKRIDSGDSLSSLAGVPIAIKDNISTKGIETTCASKILDGYIPIFDATVIERLEAAGLILVGKLNMDEFAMGGSSETGYRGPVLNPHDTARVAGGSSGGSAAAVAAGLVPLSLGSDTGGSIRQPCSFCGVTGIKPTYGAVSRYGLLAYASSLDQIGPVANNIDDCAALLEIISGPDIRDSTCTIKNPFSFGNIRTKDLDGVRIGLPQNYLDSGIDWDVKDAICKAAIKLERAGAAVTEFRMPLVDCAVDAYYVIACAEASSNLSRYDGIKCGYRSPNAKTIDEVYSLSRSEGFGAEVKRRILLGSFVLSSGYYDAYYQKAVKVKQLIKNEYGKLFERFDIILSPVAPTTAYKLGQNIDDPIKMYMGDIYTVPVNLAGLPAISLPCGTDSNGLPIGMQLIGNKLEEKKLVSTARVWETL